MGAGKTVQRGQIRGSAGTTDSEIRPGEPIQGAVRDKLGQRQQQQKQRQQQQREESRPESIDPSALLDQAESLLREGRAENALPLAQGALDAQREATNGNTTTAALPALNSLAEIHLELGNLPLARACFLSAVSLDPDGRIPSTQGGGADKFLQLAQLSDQGGHDSVGWFQRGAEVLRREIADGGEEGDEKRRKLAGALCGVVEVYMTDLSWEADAEGMCERMIAEALLVAPGCAEVLQTLGSVKISQGRLDEAREALRGSLAVWLRGPAGEDDEEEEGDEDEEEAEGVVPDFPTRISLARLLMEVGMEEEALGVVERLVLEDDGSVESWYLGGWCLYLLGGKQTQGREGGENKGAGSGDEMDGVNGDGDNDGKERKEQEDLFTQTMVSSREWLRQSLKLYEMVEYEDERLRGHAVELVGELDGIIGEEGEDVAEGAEEEWNGFGEDDEEEEQEEKDDDGDDDNEAMDEG